MSLAVALAAKFPEPKTDRDPRGIKVGLICWSLMGSDDVGKECWISSKDAYLMAKELKESPACTDWEREVTTDRQKRDGINWRKKRPLTDS